MRDIKRKGMVRRAQRLLQRVFQSCHTTAVFKRTDRVSACIWPCSGILNSPSALVHRPPSPTPTDRALPPDIVRTRASSRGVDSTSSHMTMGGGPVMTCVASTAEIHTLMRVGMTLALLALGIKVCSRSSGHNLRQQSGGMQRQRPGTPVANASCPVSSSQQLPTLEKQIILVLGWGTALKKDSQLQPSTRFRIAAAEIKATGQFR